MAEIDRMVENFLAQKRIAIVGVSETRETAGNFYYQKFKDAGCTVYAINPKTDPFSRENLPKIDSPSQIL